jgi:hypothetical protein
MSTVVRQLKEVPEKSYISAVAFNNDVYTYTMTQNPTTLLITGILAANVSGATAVTCAAGTILRENGKKLYPRAHTGVTTLMVGVFWNSSKTDTTTSNMLSGFIDPNSPKFAVFSADRPNYMNVLPVDPTGGLPDQSAPSLTNGIVNLREDLTVGGNSSVSGNSLVSGTLSVTSASTLTGGLKVATTGTLITRILKGTMQAAADLSSQGANTPTGGSQILVCPLPVSASIDDSIIVNQRGDIGGWVQTSSWIEGGSARVKMMFQGSVPGQGAVSRPVFNFTLIQS